MIISCKHGKCENDKLICCKHCNEHNACEDRCVSSKPQYYNNECKDTIFINEEGEEICN